MERSEIVCVLPVAARLSAFVEQQHRHGLCLVQQESVDKCHARGAGSHDKVVDSAGCHFRYAAAGGWHGAAGGEQQARQEHPMAMRRDAEVHLDRSPRLQEGAAVPGRRIITEPRSRTRRLTRARRPFTFCHVIYPSCAAGCSTVRSAAGCRARSRMASSSMASSSSAKPPVRCLIASIIYVSLSCCLNPNKPHIASLAGGVLPICRSTT